MLPIDAPSECGSMRINLSIPPVSFQAAATKKSAIRAALTTIVSPTEYLLAGDVQIAIEWRISALARYQSDNSADVDNIVKPILDALSGPDGIMIDDCQVQSLACYWTGGFSGPDNESVSIELGFDPDAYLPKAGLVFLHVERGLHFPIHDASPAAALLIGEHITKRFQDVREMTSIGTELGPAHLLLPIQRVFHRSKIRGFRTTTLEELRARTASG